MKRRLLSLFLAFVTILSLLPTAAFAASSEEDALGEVDIYNGDYELGYLAINGAVKKQKYTYFLYESNDGSTKESPAYCVNPNQYGVPQTVGPGESIKYLANERPATPRWWASSPTATPTAAWESWVWRTNIRRFTPPKWRSGAN